MEEAIDRGVPLLVIPFMVDQNTNALRIKKLKIGTSLDIKTITKESLKSAIEEVINGEYAKNIKKLREIVQDSPMKPLDKATWWVEYVIRNGGTLHLDYPGRHVPFWKYMMLDFIGIGIVFLHICLRVLNFVFGKLYGCGKEATKEKSKEKRRTRNAKIDKKD